LGQSGRFEIHSNAYLGLKMFHTFKVRILTDAVDDITTVDDFLAVTENHILEDVNECVAALQV